MSRFLRLTNRAFLTVMFGILAGCSSGYTRYDGSLDDCTNTDFDGDAILFHFSDQERPQIVFGFGAGVGASGDTFITVELDDPQVSDRSMSGEGRVGISFLLSINLDIDDDRLTGTASFDSTNADGEVTTDRCDAQLRLEE